MKEKVIRSTKAQIKEFTKSFIWLDIVDQLRDLKRRTQFEYDLVGEPHVDDQGFKIVPNTSETLIHLGDIKGRKKAIDYFLSIPDIIIQALEIEESEKKNKT
jgi:hypothetical protein